MMSHLAKGVAMSAFSTLAKPFAAAFSHIASSVTYDVVPQTKRANYCPYLGQVPYFAPKLTLADKQRIEDARQ